MGSLLDQLELEIKGDSESHGERELDEETAQVDRKWMLVPRSKRTLYDTILDKMRLWKRPPHDHCERCESYTKTRLRLVALSAALASAPMDTDHQAQKSLIEKAGGPPAAWEELRACQNKLPDLQKHVEWFEEQRPYLKDREVNMPETTALFQLDYGGFTDSANKKVSCWSATVITKHRPQEHFDFFFDAANQNKQPGKEGAKKDGATGVFLLDEMLDPKRGPDGKISLFSSRYPHVNHIIFSGDTGNGYRSYGMVEAHSCLKERTGISCELTPLSPAHAHNRTDARIAHMNTFLTAIKEKSRVFGAEGIARAFHAAADPARTKQRKFLARSHVFFRVVPATTRLDASFEYFDKTIVGAMMADSRLDKGRMGVRGFLYFNFSFEDAEGKLFFPQGYARVREHGR